jgi:hypothetical protein
MVSVLASSAVDRGFIGDVMVSVLASSVVDRGFIGDVVWNNSPSIDMLPHSDTLSWFRANQSLLFLLNTAWWAEKQQTPI